MSTSRLVVVGGQNTGHEMLERVANTAVGLQLADDAEVFTLGRAMRMPDKLKTAISGGLVLQHSLGCAAVRRVVSHDALPELVVDCNGVEPMGVLEGVRRLQEKRRAAFHPDALPHLAEMWRHNKVQAVRHPIDNTRYALEVRKASALRDLDCYLKMGTRALAVRYADDGLTPYVEENCPPAVPVLLRAGGHDQILTHPEEELRAIRTELDATPTS